MLLWVLILTLSGRWPLGSAATCRPKPAARVLAVQAAVTAAFYAFILSPRTPSPARGAAFDGQDLNRSFRIGPRLPSAVSLPRLRRLSMSFSFAVAALIEGRVDAAWGRWVRPWTLAWVFLTIGSRARLVVAYYELGWGGFWF